MWLEATSIAKSFRTLETGPSLENDGRGNPCHDRRGRSQLAEDMSYLGHDDWRVPNIQELLSLVNFGNTFQAAAPLLARFDQELLGTGRTYLGGTWSSTFVQPAPRSWARPWKGIHPPCRAPLRATSRRPGRQGSRVRPAKGPSIVSFPDRL